MFMRNVPLKIYELQKLKLDIKSGYKSAATCCKGYDVKPISRGSRSSKHLVHKFLHTDVVSYVVGRLLLFIIYSVFYLNLYLFIAFLNLNK